MKETNSVLRDHPIFICGHPKSGTTLLRAMFDSHPQLVVYPDETFYFRGFLPEIKTLSFDEKFTLAQRYLLHYFDIKEPLSSPRQSKQNKTDRYQLYAHTCEEMRQQLPYEEYRHDGDLLSSAILAFGTTQQQLNPETRYWVEKTPYNEHFSKSIYQWWSEARCIHVVRDPRDNYATYHRKHRRLAAEDFSLSWNASLEVGYENLEKYGSSRYLIIRYEDLVQNPEEKIREIITFLEIRDDVILKQPTKNGIPWEGNSMFDDRFLGISTKPIGRWKSELISEDVRVIEAICHQGMHRMHYPYQHGFSLGTYWRLALWNIKQALKLPKEVSKVFKHGYSLLP